MKQGADHQVGDDGQLPTGSDRAARDHSLHLAGQDVERQRKGSARGSVLWPDADQVGQALRVECVAGLLGVWIDG